MAPARKGKAKEEQAVVSLGPQAKEGELIFGVAHIFASFNDTFVHITDISGKIIILKQKLSNNFRTWNHRSSYRRNEGQGRSWRVIAIRCYARRSRRRWSLQTSELNFYQCYCNKLMFSARNQRSSHQASCYWRNQNQDPRTRSSVCSSCPRSRWNEDWKNRRRYPNPIRLHQKKGRSPWTSSLSCYLLFERIHCSKEFICVTHWKWRRPKNV